MTKLFFIKNRRNLAISSVMVSVVALAAIVGIAASIGASSGAINPFSQASGNGAVFIIDNNASGNNVWAYPRASNGQLGSVEGPFSTGGLGTG